MNTIRMFFLRMNKYTTSQLNDYEYNKNVLLENE